LIVIDVPEKFAAAIEWSIFKDTQSGLQMKGLPFFVALLFCSSGAFAQTQSSITVKAGTSINEAVPVTELYEYPQFTPGKVFFRNGTTSEARLNHHRLLDEMQFIANNGDTLALANEKTITLITIGTDTFFYDPGFVKLVSTNHDLKLGIKHSLKVSDNPKEAGYGSVSSTAAIKSVGSYVDGQTSYNLKVREDIVLLKVAQFYLGDKYNHFVLANKRNVLELFPKQHEALKKYLKATTIDFSNKADLETLLQFLAQL
jgi:hypothetical protein